MIGVRNNGEINTKIMKHSRTQTYHLMAILIFRIAEMAGNFLTRREIIIFSRRALLLGVSVGRRLGVMKGLPRMSYSACDYKTYLPSLKNFVTRIAPALSKLLTNLQLDSTVSGIHKTSN
jgi:hypothetical protein